MYHDLIIHTFPMQAFLNYAAAEISLKHYSNAATALQQTLNLNPNDLQARCVLYNSVTVITNNLSSSHW